MLNPKLILVAVIWGVNFSVLKYAIADFQPLAFTVARFSLAALFLTSIMLITREDFSVSKEDRPAIIRLGFIGITLYNIFFMYGLKHTAASHSALFISMSPLFAALIQAKTGKERLTLNTGAGFLLASLGAFLIIQSHSSGLNFSSQGFMGDLLTICASVFWALYTMKAKPLLEKYSAIKVTACSMAAGSVMLLPIAAYDIFQQDWGAISAPSWAGLAFAAFISGGLAFTLWYQGVKRIGVTRTIVYHYIVPFVAVVFAALFLGERITALQLIGGILILTGVYLVQRVAPEGRKVRG